MIESVALAYLDSALLAVIVAALWRLDRRVAIIETRLWSKPQ
jgi:hypothetical protein